MMVQYGAHTIQNNNLICLGFNPRLFMRLWPYFLVGFKHLIFINFSKMSRFSFFLSAWVHKFPDLVYMHS